ncbi:MAG: hypothetical protein IKV97_01850 [Clostridia bacterium]|nr:hypothetical protein [Clostridia bacterium]
MLKIFAGLKGSGKTKNLIEMVNAAAENANGNVVCIEQGTKLIHEITNKARLIDTITYSVDDWQKLYGFVCGILASNYDISDLFIDSALKICRDEITGFEEFVRKVLPLLEENNINFTITASVEVEKIPESLKAYLA